MKKRKLSLLFAIISSAFLIGGCEKQDKTNTQDVSFDLLFSSTEQNEIDTIQQDTAAPSTELPPESTQEKPSETEQIAASTLEQTPTSNPDKATTKSVPASQPESQIPASDSKTDKPEGGNPPEDLSSAALTTITKTFEPAENWTSDISFQMPEDWSYTAYEPSEPDWGFTIQVQKREDAFINIFGQYGTLTFQSSSVESPKDFTTASGLTGKLYPDTYTENDITYINYQIVFDLASYGVSTNMPESVYNENKELIQQLLQSIVIKDSISE